MTAPMLDYPALLEPELAHTPMGRLGTPAEVAGARRVPRQLGRELRHRPRPSPSTAATWWSDVPALPAHYHVGIIVPDVRAARARFTELLGVTWGPVMHMDDVEYRAR